MPLVGYAKLGGRENMVLKSKPVYLPTQTIATFFTEKYYTDNEVTRLLS